MDIRFTKMQGLGNDFMVIDGITQSISLSTEQIRQWGDRHFGIGFDQLLLVEKPDSELHDFKYRIFNNDGSEVEQCGNGARCFAKFVYEQGLSQKTNILVETAKGIIQPERLENGQIRVNMGEPILDPSQIPALFDHYANSYSLTALNQTLEVGSVSMGNPHAVLLVDDVDTAPVQQLGAAIEVHPMFPQKVNVGFLQVILDNEIKLRVFERGAGETLACGTGACAAVVSGILRNKLSNRVTVHTRGGDLIIEWQGIGHPVWMTGPAITVFHGVLEIG